MGYAVLLAVHSAGRYSVVPINPQQRHACDLVSSCAEPVDENCIVETAGKSGLLAAGQ
jgi:hypothetical protein